MGATGLGLSIGSMELDHHELYRTGATIPYRTSNIDCIARTRVTEG